MHNYRLALTFVFLFLLTTCTKFVAAQCTGNVLFYENFGGGLSSPLTGSPLAPGITTYAFDSLGLINDGEYGIRKTTADIATGGRQFNSWHIGYDHSSGGNMMVINADYTAGKFYETRVNNLCSGSQLYFSAWIANLIPLGLSNPLDPVIRFEISSATSGNVLASFITPTIPRYSNFTWERYGFPFALPTGETSVILRIFNNQAGGIGNDLALDDIEFTLCGPAMTTSLNGAYQNSNDACIGSNLQLSVNVANGFYANPAYQWQFNNGNGWANIPFATTTSLSISNAQTSDSGAYRLLVAEAVNINSTNCRAISPVINANVYRPQAAQLRSNAPVCEQLPLYISTPVTALQYNWSKGSTIINNQNDSLIFSTASVNDGGTYNLQLITNGGCVSNGSITVAVQPNLFQQLTPTDTVLCDAQVLPVDVQQTAPTTYLWNDGNTSAQRTFSNIGTYTLLTTDNVCSRRDTFIISRNFTPTVALGNDTSLCYSEQVTLHAKHPLAEAYLWSNNSTDTSITVTTPGLYTVAVSNFCGVATDEIMIDFKDCADMIFVPNIFTPNSDGLNDVLKAKAYFRIDSFELKIYNRWGQQIFVSSSLNIGWNGTMNNQKAPPGQYVWTLVYKRNDKLYKQKGTVLLIP
ncbi:gliding motility-associated C-terminal domain-containing protein [Lacibacter luteus]|uniref:Gliding motility-associated C-terminal domain-containing protein n=1 Tax=Lacibacter luteus TaxID=2508719 RepID=A0A4Q1CHI0_9BACT|nr:gliding motility-associated C-terminal domain-containing protein [Lacibacter luteus]RXK59787.1 gliding motility-associated C-terminal domain-containing protein [Lacibacter luteus]